MMLEPAKIAILLELLGAVMIAHAALRVHHRVLYEHKIDKQVFMVMRREQYIGWLGVGLLAVGKYIQLILL